MIYCRHCGTQQEPLKFCRHCGKPLDVPLVPGTSAPDKVATVKASAGDSDFFNSLGSLDGGLSEPAPRSAAPTPPPAKPPVHTAPVTPPPARTAPVTPPPARTAPVTPPPAAARPTAPVTPTPTAAAPAAAAAAKARVKPMRRISFGRELRLLLRQGTLILCGDKRNLLISLLFPLIAGAVTVWVAGENMFKTYEGTQSACFILVCAAIWCGLFNSIQSLVKERDNIKRDYVSGALRIESYMTSRAIIQIILCAIQSLVLTVSIPVACGVWDNTLPDNALVTGWIISDFYISLFLVMLASDAMGLMISSMVKKEELASKLAPYILIAQLLFSGVLFSIDGAFMQGLSAIMVSRWGMEALGSISNLYRINTLTYDTANGAYIMSQPCACPENAHTATCSKALLGDMQYFSHTGDHPQFFESTSEHLIIVWLIMLGFVVVSLVGADLLLHRVKKDGRD